MGRSVADATENGYEGSNLCSANVLRHKRMVSTDNRIVMGHNCMLSTDNRIVMGHKPMVSTDNRNVLNRGRGLSVNKGTVMYGDCIVPDCIAFVSVDRRKRRSAIARGKPLKANSQQGSTLPSSRGDAVYPCVPVAMLFAPFAEP